MQEQEEEKGSRHIEQPHALEGDTANGTPETRNHTEPISSSVATDLGVENYSEVEAADSECDQHISDEEVEREELVSSHLNEISASTAKKIQDQRNDHLIYGKPYTGRSLSKEILYHHVRSGTSQSNCSEEELEPLEQQHYLAKYGINFEDFTFNPCTLPNNKHCSNGGNSSAGFDRWLKTSPYRIWITKHWVERPYGQCKYPHFGKIFLFEKHPTSSNIVKHYKANHKKDWEKFNAKVTKRKQKTLVSMKNVSHSEINPFRLTKNTVDFLSQNEGMIKLLNMFISSLLPFKLVEDPAFRELALLENGCVKNGYTICRKTLVNSMESYHQILEEEMQNILEKTSQINLLLDIWTSVNGKSYLAILASFCPNLNVAENSTFSKSAANQRNPNTHIIAFHDISHERHTAAYLKEIIIRTLADKKLQLKVASVTFDNATNNVKMMEMIDTDLTGEGVNEVGGIVKIQCFNHILNLIFKKIMRHFEGENQMLVSRIDVLSTKMKNNIFLRTQFQQYTKKLLPVHAIRGLYLVTNSQTPA